jgi:fructose-bisphosphate aldolase class II
MTKINIATHLNQVFTESIRATLNTDSKIVDSRPYLGPARDAVAAEANGHFAYSRASPTCQNPFDQ